MSGIHAIDNIEILAEMDKPAKVAEACRERYRAVSCCHGTA